MKDWLLEVCRCGHIRIQHVAGSALCNQCGRCWNFRKAHR